jgi:hypothetical protein
LDEGKSTHTGLVQKNGFGPVFLHNLLTLVKGQQSLTPAREECNKYGLTAHPCF